MADGAEVEFREDIPVLDHGDDDGRDDVQGVDVELGDAGQVLLDVEFREHDHLVAAEDAGLADDDEAVDVGLGEQAQRDFEVVGALFVAFDGVVGRDLERVGDDVAVGNHHAFGETGRAGRVAEEGGLAGALAGSPFEGFDGWEVRAGFDELGEGFVAWWVLHEACGSVRHVANVDAGFGDLDFLGCGDSRFEEGEDGEDGFRARVGELVGELVSIVGCVGGG